MQMVQDTPKTAKKKAVKKAKQYLATAEKREKKRAEGKAAMLKLKNILDNAERRIAPKKKPSKPMTTRLPGVDGSKYAFHLELVRYSDVIKTKNRPRTGPDEVAVPQYGVRLRASNGRILLSSEGYTSKRAAVNCAWQIYDGFWGAHAIARLTIHPDLQKTWESR